MHGRSGSDIGIASILLSIIAIGLAVVGIASAGGGGGSSSPGVPLGTWTSMPSAATELMGNTSYRGILIPTSSASTLTGIQAGIAVNCITASNTVGANLQLQYALYSFITDTNTTNFQSIGLAQVFIDGVTANSCVNNTIVSDIGSVLNVTTAGLGYVFRVMGSGGGGSGDNPRFSSITVLVSQLITRIYMPIALSITVNGFSGRMYANVLVQIAVTANFQYVATNNGVQTDSGSGSCTIAVGTNNCSAAITFPLAFATVPNVVMTSTSPGGSNGLPIGTISLLTTQTLTV